MNKQLPERLEFLARIEEWTRFERLVYESMLSVFSSKGIELNDVFQDVDMFTMSHLAPFNRDISKGYYGYFVVEYKTLPNNGSYQTYCISGPLRDEWYSFTYEIKTGYNEGLKTNNIDEISRFILDKVLEKEE